MAEGVFAHLVQEAGLSSKIEIDSAGTGDWHVGSLAHHGTRDILQLNGIKYSGCARQITATDLENFDYVITMDEENFYNVQQLGKAKAQVAPLLSFANNTDLREVPDPYYVGGFDRVYDLVYDGCEGLLEHIRSEHKI
jgi:protein-tyrosine phosphatase